MQPKQNDFLGEILTEGIDGQIVLIGFPHEIGSKRLNNPIAYAGLENGPDCLRRFLPKLGALYNAEYDICLEKLNFKDYGNIHLQGPNQKNLEALLEKLKQKCMNLYKRSAIPIIIGGGRDLVYGPIAGLFEMNEKKRVLHVNLMSSLDCEVLYDGSKITANNFLRKILYDYSYDKQTTSTSYKTIYFCIEENKLSKRDREFVKQNQEIIELITIKTIRKTPELQEKSPNFEIITQAGRAISEFIEKYNDFCDYIHLSVSLESINAAYCPGVSNPCVVGGLSSEEIIEIMRYFGSNKKVGGVDITDYNPRFEDYRTGFLLGYILYYFNLGYMMRSFLK